MTLASPDPRPPRPRRPRPRHQATVTAVGAADGHPPPATEPSGGKHRSTLLVRALIHRSWLPLLDEVPCGVR